MKLVILVLGGLSWSVGVQAGEETVDPGLHRTVLLDLKAEEHAVKYFVEIDDLTHQKTEHFEVTKPQWEGRLPLGKFRSRFKVKFQDETESNWSDDYEFSVVHYVLTFQNLDQDITTVQHNNEGPAAVLVWNPISDAKSYKLILTQRESYFLEKSPLSIALKMKKPPQQPPQSFDLITSNQFILKNPDPGFYEAKLIAKNAENKTIAFYQGKIEILDPEILKPVLVPPLNEFVRILRWRPIKGISEYKLAIYQQQDGASEEKIAFKDDHFRETEFEIPASWTGGNYRYCVTGLIKFNTYSSESCAPFKVREGDRSLAAEKDYYRNILKQRQQQHYHQFSLIASMVDYSSKNPSTESLVDLQGFVMNLSYAKSNPTEFTNLNTHYKLNLGLLKVEDKTDFTYDFRYAGEWTQFNFYPFVFKSSAGLGIFKIIQASADPQSLQVSSLDSHHIVNASVDATVRYNFLDRLAFDFKIGYIKPFLEISKSNDSGFSGGEAIEYSLTAVFNSFRANDKIEIGYVHRQMNSSFNAEAPGFDHSHVSEAGHYLGLGYIAESK